MVSWVDTPPATMVSHLMVISRSGCMIPLPQSKETPKVPAEYPPTEVRHVAALRVAEKHHFADEETFFVSPRGGPSQRDRLHRSADSRLALALPSTA